MEAQVALELGDQFLELCFFGREILHTLKQRRQFLQLLLGDSALPRVGPDDARFWQGGPCGAGSLFARADGNAVIAGYCQFVLNGHDLRGEGLLARFEGLLLGAYVCVLQVDRLLQLAHVV